MYTDCIEQPLEHNSAEYIHALVEMERRVYADRSEHLGDPDFWNVPIAELTDLGYLRSRMDNFQWHQATPSDSVSPGKFVMAESTETTHLSIVDAQGNAVSVTTTLNDNFGSKIVVDGAGFLLNNEMDDFSSKPGTPNMFGLLGGDANAIRPGKRMLSSMSPVIVEKDGALYLVAGSPGGSTIITSVFQTILNTAIYNYPLSEATALPKFHSQWLPDLIFLEDGRFPDSTLSELTLLKHSLRFIPSLGRVDAILVNEDGTLQVSGDPRGDNAAAGY
jgi:gamma-glutamyltranspeptidase/glutathione hydrolase